MNVNFLTISKKNIPTLSFTHVVTSSRIIKQLLCNVPRQNTLGCSCINKPINTYFQKILLHTSHEVAVMRFVNSHCLLNYCLYSPFALHQQVGTPLGIRGCLPLFSLLLFPSTAITSKMSPFLAIPTFSPFSSWMKLLVTARL